MKNKKGFTLVELLVVIVILGIITGISIPLIRNAQEAMNQKKYTTYLSSLKTSAKLYSDSYSEDMFGHNKSGVYCIKYSELEKKNLIKNISIDNVTCDKKNTYVRVVKIDDKYTYTPYLECGEKNSTKTVKYPKGSNTDFDREFCSGDVTSTILVDVDKTQIDSSSSPAYSKRIKKTKVIIRSVTGINNGKNAISLKTLWVKKENLREDNSYNMDGISPLVFKIEGNQEEMILNGEEIQGISGELRTPDEDGEFYLIVKVELLKDRNGNSWKQENGSQYLKFGPFSVDNENPKIQDGTLKVVSGEAKYNTLDGKIVFTGSDNHTDPNNLKKCISFDQNACSKIGEFTIPYPTVVTKKFADAYNGTSRRIYVSLMDKAGNKIKKDVTYRVGITHRITYGSNGGTVCNPLYKAVTHNVNDNATWGTLCNPTRTGYNFSGWKSGNTTIDANTKITGDVSVTAAWSPKTFTLTYNNNGGSGCTNKSGKYDSTWGALCTPTRAGHTFNGWYDGTAKVTANTKVTGNRTVKADWKINTYTLTYNNNGGSGCTNKKGTYGQPWGALCTPSRTGYTFKGWYDGNTLVNANTKVSGNRTVKADWKINTYKLTYNSNGGSTCNPTSISKSYNTAWGTLCTPSRANYTFDGWYNGSVRITASSKATANITATAKWKVNKPTCTITTNVNGNGFGWNNTNVTVTLNTSGIVTKKGISTTPAGAQNTTTTSTTLTNDGAYIYYGYVANDGGSSTCSSRLIKIDKTPPETDIKCFTTNRSDLVAYMKGLTFIHGRKMYNGQPESYAAFIREQGATNAAIPTYYDAGSGIGQREIYYGGRYTEEYYSYFVDNPADGENYWDWDIIVANGIPGAKVKNVCDRAGNCIHTSGFVRIGCF